MLCECVSFGRIILHTVKSGAVSPGPISWCLKGVKDAFGSITGSTIHTCYDGDDDGEEDEGFQGTCKASVR